MDSKQVAREIAGLRSGQGVDAVDLHQRVGPGLRRLCHVTAADDAGTVRRKVVAALSAALEALPPEHARAAAGALALDNGMRARFLKQRIAALAETFERDDRTVRRYVKKAIDLLAEQLIADPPHVSARPPVARDSWQVVWLSSTLRADLDPPELVERRRIVAIADGLDELELAVTARRANGAPTDGQIEIVALSGGEVIKRRDLKGDHIRFTLHLPTTLRSGQEHEYEVLVRSWAHGGMRPFYVLTPLRPTESFELRITFDRARLPRRIWRVTEAALLHDDTPVPTADVLQPDNAGEVAVVFDNLRTGLSYGVQWTPA